MLDIVNLTLMHNINMGLPKIIIISGPTGSGKTGWSLRLAKKFSGAIISADSRQLYKQMTIGTAKPRGEWRWIGWRRIFCVDNIWHFNLDWLSPKKIYSAAMFKRQAMKIISRLNSKKIVSIVVGGTGLYVNSLVDNLQIPPVSANEVLRQELNKKTLPELLIQLDELDPECGQVIDRHNPRRVIRALEVCLISGQPFSQQRAKGKEMYEVLHIGISVPREELYRRLDERVDNMMKTGLLAEVKNLAKKYDWQLPSMSGIGYREFRDYLAGTKTIEEAVLQLKQDTRNYAKRQMTWFNKDERIKWCGNYDEAESLVAEFLRM